MVDLSKYQSSILAAQEKTYNAPAEEHSGLFLDHLFLLGYKTNEIEHGVITRIADSSDQGVKKSGWYVYYQNQTVSVGIYGSWKRPEEKNIWYSKSENYLTFQERNEVAEQIKQAQETQRQSRDKLNQETAENARKLFDTLPCATDENPYLKRKQVKSFSDLRIKENKLWIPVIDDGLIVSAQTIDHDGQKRFMTGGKTKGCYFKIDGDDRIVYIAEGYATAASIAMATGNIVYVSFSAHNLYEITSYAKRKHGKIIICGDNDDTCRNKATQAQESLAVEVIYPPQGVNDFNDWWVSSRTQMLDFFQKKPEEIKKEVKKEVYDFEPSGIMLQIINYYNATAKRDQPLFAVQAAIAVCSIILGRNFQTNKENRTSLFLMNVAKSGTGKEHAKKIVEKILDATGNDYLISGDGYTSQSAVISACQERPRHITIIDEFSKYLQASQNKASGGHIAEANAALMQAIGRLEGKLRAKARASIGMSDKQRKELQNQYVVCPAITLLAMTTPEDFFNTIGTDAIKDGFVNRFIICISDVGREVPKDREPIEVPESIVNWEQLIRIRRGASDENPIIEPKTITIPFDFGCTAIQQNFHRYCIDVANNNEQFGLAEISGRSAEMAYRLALIIALSDNPNTSKIEPEHMSQAVNWIKFNLDRLVSELKANVASSEHEASKKDVLKALRKIDGIYKSDMFKRPPFSKYERKVLNAILSELLEAELITEITEEKEGAGRRRTMWRAVQ